MKPRDCGADAGMRLSSQVDRFSLTASRNSDTILRECRAQNLERGDNGVDPYTVCAPPTASIDPRMLFHGLKSTTYRCSDKEVPREQRSKAQPAHIPAPVRCDGGKRSDCRLWRRRSACHRTDDSARRASTNHSASGARSNHSSSRDSCSSSDDPIQRSADAGKTGAGR